MTSENGSVQSRMHLHSGPGEAPGTGYDGLRDRASSFAGRARDRFSDTLGMAGGAMSRRHDILDIVRDKPLSVVGIAFSAGFVIAAAGGKRKRHWLFDRARRQFRTLLVGAVTATLAHEVRELMEENKGLGNFARSRFAKEDVSDDLDELYEDEDEYDDLG
ncbi:MAG: hypothetical protein WD766_08305 [Gemmatimonadota bacterium]